MTESTGWFEPGPEQPATPAPDVGSPAADAAPPAPDPSQELPADTPAPESDTAPEPAEGEPATDPGPPPDVAEQPAEPAAEEPASVYVPDGQPSWLTELIHLFDERLRKLGG